MRRTTCAETIETETGSVSEGHNVTLDQRGERDKNRDRYHIMNYFLSESTCTLGGGTQNTIKIIYAPLEGAFYI